MATRLLSWPRVLRARDEPRSGRCRSSLIPLDAALYALGDGGSMGRQFTDVPIAQVVGSVARHDDFDGDFRPLRRHLADRLERVRAAAASGESLPPVELVRLGDLYFVADGHHRVAAARLAGQLMIGARVLTICTVAYGMACLRLIHLQSKAAEREFLQRVPLPDPVRRDLWLDRPQDWLRLADAAEAWGYRHALRHGRPMDRPGLAMTWWSDEVLPVLDRLRSNGEGVDLRDVGLYATTLTVWPDGFTGPDQFRDPLADIGAGAGQTDTCPRRRPNAADPVAVVQPLPSRRQRRGRLRANAGAQIIGGLRARALADSAEWSSQRCSA